MKPGKLVHLEFEFPFSDIFNFFKEKPGNAMFLKKCVPLQFAFFKEPNNQKYYFLLKSLSTIAIFIICVFVKFSVRLLNMGGKLENTYYYHWYIRIMVSFFKILNSCLFVCCKT